MIIKLSNELLVLKKRFNNFIKYLDSDDNYIDYTYLWDIICKANKKLFPEGINLIILEIEYKIDSLLLKQYEKILTF